MLCKTRFLRLNVRKNSDNPWSIAQATRLFYCQNNFYVSLLVYQLLYINSKHNYIYIFLKIGKQVMISPFQLIISVESNYSSDFRDAPAD